MNSDYRGVEFDWFAVDRTGNLGFFSSAGSGYVPEVVCQNLSANDLVARYFEERIDRSDPRRRVSTNECSRMAGLGFFAYDSDPNGGPYRLEATPETPRSPAEFPTAVAAALRTLSLPLVFGARASIEPCELGFSAA